MSPLSASRILLLLGGFLFIYGFIYAPFQSPSGPRPDVSWMLRQRGITALVNNFSTLVEPGSEFCSTRAFLTIVVCSAVKNFVARSAIRATWASDAAAVSTRVVFLVGRAASNRTVGENVTSFSPLLVSSQLQYSGDNETRLIEQRLLEEVAQYNDIVQADFLDTYNNLTLKSVFLLRWLNQSGCAQSSSFVLKTDDDMFINVPNLVSVLRSKGRRRLLMGCLIAKAAPLRDWSSKWYVPTAVYADERYPDYLSGTGYVISSDLVPELYRVALKTPFFYLEDIFITGILARKLNVKRVNHVGFKYQRRKVNACLFRRIISAHQVTSSELLAVYPKVKDRRFKCRS